MIGSIVFVTLVGLVVRHLCKKVNIPPLIGFLGLGIFLGPFTLDVLSDDLLNRSSEIRTILNMSEVRQYACVLCQQ